MSLIKKSDYDRINEIVPSCVDSIKACGNSQYTLRGPFPFISTQSLSEIILNLSPSQAPEGEMPVSVHIILAIKYSRRSWPL